MMKSYRSHKIVQACKILSVDTSGTDCLTLRLDDGTNRLKIVPRASQFKNAQVGGYYVIYEDGYDSYSPVGTFERGYVALPTDIRGIADTHEPTERALQLAAAAWCGPNTSHIEMDTRLAHEFAKILDKVLTPPSI